MKTKISLVAVLVVLAMACNPPKQESNAKVNDSTDARKDTVTTQAPQDTVKSK